MEVLKLEINEEKLVNKVYEEFEKTKEDVHEYIKLIQEWCKLQAYSSEIPSINGTRFFIVSWKFSIKKAKEKLDMYYTKVYANRNAAIYLINMHSLTGNILNNICKPLLPKKISERMIALSNADDLQNLISKFILPKDIGGGEYSLAELQVMMTKKFEELKPRFDKIQFMTVDESKRLEKLINDDILGFYGSFRQLNLD
ncbi:unnamed protein product [Ceutorhynchus assimilis]|uniref:CRAL-TRIO domain-containing protein n=1 Tax=Ceutorhynchus assimilis TaxID=467358 RepID=A0A9N9MED3_9CUCU|nr:unnamed protein product [Ceutorhynchus assimilis]